MVVSYQTTKTTIPAGTTFLSYRIVSYRCHRPLAGNCWVTCRAVAAAATTTTTILGATAAADLPPATLAAAFQQISIGIDGLQRH